MSPRCTSIVLAGLWRETPLKMDPCTGKQGKRPLSGGQLLRTENPLTVFDHKRNVSLLLTALYFVSVSFLLRRKFQTSTFVKENFCYLHTMPTPTSRRYKKIPQKLPC